MATRGWMILASALFSGCFHQQAYLPGVIDMRTDGSGQRRVQPRAPEERKVARAGTDAIIEGAGLAVQGSEITIEDRHYWVFGMVPVMNESPTPELEAALSAAPAYVELEVGEELDVLSLVGSIIAQAVVPVASWVTPPWSFRARAQAVAHRPAAPEAGP